jgi:hypothetical protein
MKRGHLMKALKYYAAQYGRSNLDEGDTTGDISSRDDAT